MKSERVKESAYMYWVKKSSAAKYNLVISDMVNVPFSALRVPPEELEIIGPGGYGYPPLIDAIAAKEQVDPSCVVPSVGTSLANHVAMATLLDPGDEALIEHPTYELLTSALAYLGASVTSFPRRFENRFLIDPDDVRRRMTNRTKLIVLTNLHNPSSALTDETTLRAIAEIAEAHGAYVLVDEVYLDAYFEKKQRSAFHLSRRFVATNSLTKVYGLSGLRCGWILADEDLAGRMRRITDLFHSTPAHIADRISVTAFSRLGELARRSRELLGKNSEILNASIQKCSKLRCIPHSHGLVAFPQCSVKNIDVFYELLAGKYETTVAPGRFFGIPDHFRIGIGKDTEVLREALRRLGAALDESD